ncbi:MAG: hypothetical protein RM338_13390 [Nostoc sp. DedQUE12a]|nr:hypothetical protein [Nostoc sp. DedQUE12a]
MHLYWVWGKQGMGKGKGVRGKGERLFIKKGRGQEAEGRRNTVFCPLPVTKGNKGLRQEHQISRKVASIKYDIESPSKLNIKAFCPLPPAFFNPFPFSL